MDSSSGPRKARRIRPNAWPSNSRSPDIVHIASGGSRRRSAANSQYIRCTGTLPSTAHDADVMGGRYNIPPRPRRTEIPEFEYLPRPSATIRIFGEETVCCGVDVRTAMRNAPQEGIVIWQDDSDSSNVRRSNGWR